MFMYLLLNKIFAPIVLSFVQDSISSYLYNIVQCCARGGRDMYTGYNTYMRRRQRRIPLHSLAIIFNILYLCTQTIAKVGSSGGGAERKSVCA